MQTLHNSFHNTTIRIKSPLYWDAIQSAAYRAESTPPHHRTTQQRSVLTLRNRIKRTLCGMSDCTCGTVR